MAMLYLTARIKSALLVIVNLIKRALCCFSRRRKSLGDSVPLLTVGVVPNRQDAEEWSSWGDNGEAVGGRPKPTSVQEHIESYRQSVKARQHSTDDEPAKDYFEDMTPRITKQTKILLSSQPAKEAEASTARLMFAPEALPASGELEEWEDSGGWEEQESNEWDPDGILREKRREERLKRSLEQQLKRQERSTKPVALGAKIS